MLLSCITLQAQVTFVWDDGGADDNWSTTQNWNPDASIPTASTTTRLDFSTGSSSNNDFSSIILNYITFGSGLGNNDFTITGNDITGERLGGSSGTQFRIYKNHTGNATIENNLLLDQTGSINLQLFGSNSGTLTLSGDIQGNSSGTASTSLTKFNDFTLVLTGNNTFTSRIRIRGGILESQTEDALTSSDIRIREDATLLISTQDQDFDQELRIESGQTGNVDVADGITFTLVSTGSTNGLQFDSATSILEKEGQGTLLLNKQGTGDGDIIINNGTIEIANNTALAGTGGDTTVNSGGTLALNNATSLTITGEALTLSGNGASSQNGALVSNGSSHTYDANITLGADTTISSDSAGNTLTIGATGADRSITTAGHTLTLTGAGDTTVNSQFTGTGNLVKEGSGTALLSFGSNTTFSIYSGTTTVNDGTLALDLGDVGSETPLTGTITVGDGTGTDTLETRYFDQIGDNTTVNVNSSGVLTINAGFYGITATETIGTLNLQGGALVQTVNGGGSATLALNGDVNHDGSGGSTATINGNLDLGGTSRTFSINDDTGTALELSVDATISNGGINKTGSGTLSLDGNIDASANGIDITEGTLMLGNSNIISDTTDITLSGGTLLSNGQDETFDTLTLAADSIIDLSGGNSTLSFSNSSAETWTGTLFIDNWDGSETGGGNDQILFSGSGLTTAQTQQIIFRNPVGFASGNYSATFLGGNEIVPVPEPSTYIAGILTVLLLLYGARNNKRR